MSDLDKCNKCNKNKQLTYCGERSCSDGYCDDCSNCFEECKECETQLCEQCKEYMWSCPECNYLFCNDCANGMKNMICDDCYDNM